MLLQSIKERKMGKACKFCGVDLIQKAKESPAAFLKRKYCNTTCAMNGARKDKHWRDGSWPVPTGKRWDTDNY